MIAARLANIPRSLNVKYFNPVKQGEISPCSPVTLTEAAEMHNVERTTVGFAKTVLSKGTEEEINAVRDGHASASGIAKQIRKGVPAEERKIDTKNTKDVKEGVKSNSKRLQTRAMMLGASARCAELSQ